MERFQRVRVVATGDLTIYRRVIMFLHENWLYPAQRDDRFFTVVVDRLTEHQIERLKALGASVEPLK
jgi:hypothetical protein